MNKRENLKIQIEKNKTKKEELMISKKKFFDEENLVDDELFAIKQSISMSKNEEGYLDPEIAMILDEQEELLGKLFRDRENYLDIIDREYDSQINDLALDIDDLEKRFEIIECQEIEENDNMEGDEI